MRCPPRAVGALVALWTLGLVGPIGCREGVDPLRDAGGGGPGVDAALGPDVGVPADAGDGDASRRDASGPDAAPGDAAPADLGPGDGGGGDATPTADAGAGDPWAAVRAAVEAHAARTGDAFALRVYDARDALRFELAVNGYDPAARVALASASKWVSALVLLRLVGEGRLDLEDTTGAVLGWTGANRAITLRQLLSFTSGLEPSPACTSRPAITLAACVDELRDLPLVAAPGTRFDYGSSHLHVAARMAEVRLGQTWNALFVDVLATPLGIVSPDARYFTAPRQAIGQINPLVAGGLRATPDEYARVLALAFHRGRFGGRALIPEALLDAQTVEPFPSVAIGNSPAVAAGQPYRYGLGVWLECARPADGCDRVSSPGAFGFTPWIDRGHRYYAMLAMELDRRGEVVSSSLELEAVLQPLIAAALGTLDPGDAGVRGGGSDAGIDAGGLDAGTSADAGASTDAGVIVETDSAVLAPCRGMGGVAEACALHWDVDTTRCGPGGCDKMVIFFAGGGMNCGPLAPILRSYRDGGYVAVCARIFETATGSGAIPYAAEADRVDALIRGATSQPRLRAAWTGRHLLISGVSHGATAPMTAMARSRLDESSGWRGADTTAVCLFDGIYDIGVLDQALATGAPGGGQCTAANGVLSHARAIGRYYAQDPVLHSCANTRCACDPRHAPELDADTIVGVAAADFALDHFKLIECGSALDPCQEDVVPAAPIEALCRSLDAAPGKSCQFESMPNDSHNLCAFTGRDRCRLWFDALAGP